MKKIFILLAITTAIFTSCDSGNDKNTVDAVVEAKPLLNKITNNGDFIGTYTYDGEKALKYTDSRFSLITITYTYTNDLITEIKEHSNIFQYEYENNKLVSMNYKSSQAGSGFRNNSKFVYTYPSAFAIEGKEYKYDSNDVLFKDFISKVKYTINSGNIAKIETFSREGILQQTKTYEYDNKNNSFKNVKGFDKLLYPEKNSKYNIMKEQNIDGHGGGYNYTTEYAYIYNDKGYPTSMTKRVINNVNGTSDWNSFTLIY